MNTWWKQVKKGRWGYLMVAPLMVGLALFCIYPFFYGITLSFFDVSTSNPVWTPVGFGNYRELFHDPVFWNSCKTMMIFLLPKLLINIFVPFIFAEIVFALKSKKAAKVYRVLLLLPVVAPGVVGLLIWKNLYGTDGLFNAIFTLFSGQKVATDWLNSDAAPYQTIIALILLGFPWVGGTSVLIYLSGLMSISDEIFEAATLDGCGKWRRIFSIDMPLCMGQFRYFLIFGIINGLQDYGIQIVLYKIAPDYVYVPGYYLYRMAYTNDRSGYASAIGVCLFIVIISLTLLANRLTKKDKEAA
jgi:ABC-type sugar transport system permease subunit